MIFETLWGDFKIFNKYWLKLIYELKSNMTFEYLCNNTALIELESNMKFFLNLLYKFTHFSIQF